jgi:hypothetical protein
MNTHSQRLPWLRTRGVLILLMLAYLLSSALIIMQQRTIESQRALIRDLFRDSMELTQLKVKHAAVKH